VNLFRSVLVPLGVVASALLWRFGGTPGAAAASGLTVAVAVLVIPLAVRRTGVTLGLLALLAALVAAAGLLPRIWPCEAGCSEGRDYGFLFGYPVLWFAVPGYAALAVLALAERRRPRHRAVTQLGAWMFVGASLYYCLVALQLRMVCPHCLAVHTAVFCFWGVLLRDSSRAIFGAAAALGAAALLHWHYHPDFLRREAQPGGETATLAETGPAAPASAEIPGAEEAAGEAPKPPAQLRSPEELPPEERAWFEQADAGRCRGSPDAPLRLELLQSFSCSKCADSHEKVVGVLASLLDGGKVRLVSRHFLSVNNDAGRQLVRLAFAAAATGAYSDYKNAAYAAQAIPEDLSLRERRGAHTAEAQLQRLYQRIDETALLSLITKHGSAVELLVNLDARFTAPHTKSGAPQLLLFDARTGEKLEHWSRDLDLAAVHRAIRQYSSP
jgi:hypothetical protein